ncbi:murein hydrolase activator EnvC family protein [Thermoflexibacter ruber]|uniref:Septal ring factor EnvC, activator of murein hydrolases AmiA and AmiB n=1 Tax=Thermoflexibacter ruber TaxID=1003 RepID=A0A1I2HND8_9BACT|nr:peptidoglycan DD-metalloendopeptidase family protein [Thermoflexibacter ruber]SFF30246.1 Septal ring factor EnvC, activator of murein hydrolases AmiA and AmiB [Thermoflexibacter ruber]
MRNLLILLLCCYWTHVTVAQKTKQELDKERVIQQKKIQEADQVLKKTRHFKELNISKLDELNRQIERRNHLMSTILQEIPLIDQEIAHADSLIKTNEKLLQKLKDEYAEMIYLSAKVNNSLDKLSFIFSSESFNQLTRRLNYLKQYDEGRKKQIKKIEKHQKELASQKQRLQQQKVEKANLLSDYENQQQKLKELQSEQLLIISSLKNRERELFIEIENRKKAMLQLDKAVTAAINRSSQIESNITESPSKRTPESIIVNTKSFAEAKGKLAWPVKEGLIIGRFGKHKHPVLENITIENLGIDIRTSQNEGVRVVYEGTVIAVSKVMGEEYMVLVQHGDYYTVYARLKEVKIKIGEKVKAREWIGKVGINANNGLSELQFQVWQNKKKLNPEEWLAKY